ncbi:BatD protein [Flavobacterium rivuli WB 3.3-2 = DSM 21788]|uniref:BatD protein n=1 Tax=Flavobacterium rivuli WB 3.3-2 = DSM 21788 TaxID=1121895 RepID=A0A0A2M2P5_9FLAO|nr:BatD family protein [Flavobacterium rivuli]KGO85698.1 BatD protein [Flavobacterium rivuli WB 3.3-2 = DSM 21788]
MKKYILIVFLLLSLQGLFAQQPPVEFKATPSRTKIGVNERVRVEFSMNQDGDNFVPPTFQGFTASGPGQMISNSWVNGVRSFNKSYTYVLLPKAKGTFTVGQATIEIGGKTYKSSPFKIEVGEAVANPNPQPAPSYNPYNPYQRQQQQQQQERDQQMAQKPGDGIHLVAEIANTSPYVNQPVNVVYKLYVSNNSSVTNFFEKESPQYNDFWSQNELVDGQHMKVEQGTFKGEPYRYVILRKTVLYPQKSGRLELEPLVVELNTEIFTGRRDMYGRPEMQPAKTQVTTGKKYITVRPLPEAGKPESFTGAVGDFDFKVIPGKTTLKAGESLQLTVTVSGKGNLKLFNLPKPVVPDALEMYDPEHKENVKTPLTGMTGSISDLYTIVPNKKGKYPIKPLSFSWFDLSTGKYKTVTSPEIMVNVLSVPENAAIANNKKLAKQTPGMNETFRPVMLKTSLKAVDREDFFGSALYYILLFLPLIFVPVIVLAKKKKDAYDSDVTGNKIRQNNKLARKYLSDAKKQLGNKEPFYLALEKALHNFLKARLNIETAELSRDNVRELLLSRNAKPETVNEFSTIMDSCEFARYAPSSGTAMQQDYDNAVKVITDLSKQI